MKIYAAVKMIWNLPYATHTRFLESLSPAPHLESTLMSRYIGFIDNLVKTKKNVLSLIFSELILFGFKIQKVVHEGSYP